MVTGLPVTYRSSRVGDESASMKLWEWSNPRGVPRSPSRFPSRFWTAVSFPPILNDGFCEIRLPVHTVPITARMVPSSKLTPYTSFIAVTAPRSDTTPSRGMYPWFASAFNPGPASRRCMVSLLSPSHEWTLCHLALTWSSLVAFSRRLEDVFASDTDGLGKCVC